MIVVGVVGVVVVVLGAPIGLDAYRNHKDEQQWKAQVVADFYDPASAQFRNLVVSRAGLCGEVNGKNRLGAYVGFRKFYSDRRGFYLEPDQDLEADSSESESDLPSAERRLFDAMYSTKCEVD